MKNKFLVISLFLSITLGINAQSLKDLFNTQNLEKAVDAISGKNTLSAEVIIGTWKYKDPAIELQGDNAMKNIAGVVAAGEFEKKIKESFDKAGIVEGSFSFTFNTDKTFCCNWKGKNINGTYVLNSEEKTIDMNFGKVSQISLGQMSGNINVTGETMRLVFNADKLLGLVSILSLYSNNNTIKALSKLAEQYDGMMLGFDLQK